MNALLQSITYDDPDQEYGKSGTSDDVISVSFSDNEIPSSSEIPDSFYQGLKDVENGRVVDLDVAHEQAPPEP